MQVDLATVLERLHQPEYTGENRCVPCTIVNLTIAVVLAAAIARRSKPTAIIAFALSSLLIYLRGYLVPGTPTLTKQYFPDWLLAKFDKGPDRYGIEFEPVDATTERDSSGREVGAESDSSDSSERETVTEADETATPEHQLVSAGVVAPCVDEDDLCLDESVRAAWRERIDALRDGDRTEQVNAFLEREAGDLVVDDSRKHGIVVRNDGRPVATWESEAALLADLAGADILAEYIPDWEALTYQERGQLGSGLRAFLEECPTCGGSISLGSETVESCCRSYDVYAVSCEACEARLLEVTPDQ